METILEAPQGQEEAPWKYEHLRQFCNELNGIAVRMQEECDPKVCIQMIATEQWVFLCAAHHKPKECSALDYTLHTLDGAAALLNSNKHFPSRVSVKESSVQRLSSVARRLYRIFSHAYYHHRKLFDEYEESTYLCKRFTRYVMKYGLMSADNLIVPIENWTFGGGEEKEVKSAEETTGGVGVKAEGVEGVKTAEAEEGVKEGEGVKGEDGGTEVKDGGERSEKEGGAGGGEVHTVEEVEDGESSA